MKNKLQQDVTAFHKAMGHPAPDEPVLELDVEEKFRLINRATWMIEEAVELIQAAIVGDLIGVIDALADSTYFSVGGFVTLALDMDDFWRNVQDANMDKLDENGKPVPHPTIPGKIGKPAGWIAPEARHQALIAELLAEREEQLALKRAQSAPRSEDV